MNEVKRQDSSRDYHGRAFGLSLGGGYISPGSSLPPPITKEKCSGRCNLDHTISLDSKTSELWSRNRRYREWTCLNGLLRTTSEPLEMAKTPVPIYNLPFDAT